MDELFDLIMLDNDLGDVRPGYNGVAIAKFIRIGELQRQATFVVHSMNVVANKRIFDELNYAGYEVRSMPGGWKQVQKFLSH